jgi:hypothetical protein
MGESLPKVTSRKEPMAAAKRKAARKAAPKRKKAGRRELIDTGTNKLFVRRNARGTSFTKVVDAGKSITADKRVKAKRTVASGQGDKGDRKPASR